MASASCGGSSGTRTGDTARLFAGKATWVSIEAPSGSISDSSKTEGGSTARAILPSGRVGFSVFLALCSDGTADGRAADLTITGASNVESAFIPARVEGDSEFSSVMYSLDDTSYVERLWPRGSGEVLVLQASAPSESPRTLLPVVQHILASAAVEPWQGLRRVELSSRSADQIRSEIESQDVVPPPAIDHHLSISVDPGSMTLSVCDSLSVDFRLTSMSGVRFRLPHLDSDAPEGIAALEGECFREIDSLLCVPDSSSGLFRGVYTASFDGFYCERDGFVKCQVRLSSSFSAGEWFYPGASIPSSVTFSATVPRETDFYCPLPLTGSSSSEGLTTYDYSSPEGGLVPPLPWAAGHFDERALADGRTLLVCSSSIERGQADEAALWIDRLAATLWNEFGFEGARFDVVLLENPGTPVSAIGPGCLLISPGLVTSLASHDRWADSLSSGLRPRSAALVARSAEAMFLLSTYLPEDISAALSTYSVYLFERDWGTAGSADSLLESLRLYYLNACETAGGIEYSVGDPALLSSPLAEPVLLGKAPLVLALFSSEIPGFDYGLGRALGNMRHSGYGYGRIASACYLSATMEDFFWSWLYLPGVPQIRVEWADSADRVYLRLEQLQPGPGFPLAPDRASLIFSSGVSYEDYLTGPDSRGRYSAPVYSWAGRLEGIRLWPDLTVPADITYERQGRVP